MKKIDIPGEIVLFFRKNNLISCNPLPSGSNAVSALNDEKKNIKPGLSGSMTASNQPRPQGIWGRGCFSNILIETIPDILEI